MKENIDKHWVKWLAFTGIALLSFGCYLDYTIVNVALPTIQQSLQANLISLQWVMNIYFLALCILATIMGRFGDLYGRRRCFYMGAGIFAIASVMAGLSNNISWLIAARLLQGISAAIVFPLGPSILPQLFPENEQAKAIAWFGSLGGIALALGPVIGGLIVSHWGWRWIFFINIPIILLGYLFCFKSIKEVASKNKHTDLDIKGMTLLGLSLCGIILGLIRSSDTGWSDLLTISYIVLGIIAGLLLFKIEKKQENPLIDFKDFRNLLFFSGVILCFLAGLLSAVTLFFDPLYLQIIKGQSPQFSGFVLFAIPIAVFLAAFLVDELITRFGIIPAILVGLGLACLSSLLHTFFTSQTNLFYIIFTFICLGSLWAMGNTLSIIAAQKAVGRERASVATGTAVTMFNIGGSLGLALSVIIYHFVTSKSLLVLFRKYSTNLSESQFSYLQTLIANPAHSLQSSMNDIMHHIFSNVFMSGFVAAMWFLFLVSLLILILVLIWKNKTKI